MTHLTENEILNRCALLGVPVELQALVVTTVQSGTYPTGVDEDTQYEVGAYATSVEECFPDVPPPSPEHDVPHWSVFDGRSLDPCEDAGMYD